MKAVLGGSWHWNYFTSTSDDSLPDGVHEKLLDSKKVYISVLRDPIERWVSGIVQCRIREQTNTSWEDIFDRIVFDNHTEPQVSFLNTLDTDDLVWFYCNSNLKRNVQTWINENNTDMQLPDVDSDWENSYNFSYKKNSVEKSIYKEAEQQIKDHPEYKQKLLDFYGDDFKLINTVNFYGI